MIRSNVPMPLLFRLHMRAKLLAGRGQTGLTSHKKRSGFEAERAIWANKTFRTSAGNAGTTVATECTPALWSEFVDQYESFTGALCTAAKDGCTTAVEREFAIARRWFARFYPVVAIRFRPFLDAEFNSVDSGVAVAKAGGDALESMFGASTLGEMLRLDSGDLIPRIHRISEAVYRCQESFRAE